MPQIYQTIPMEFMTNNISYNR